MYKVLIVEDEDFIRRGLVYTIDWLKMQCVVTGEAGDGDEGLKKIISLQPDIVITDIRMPGLSGLEMIQQAKEQGCSFCSIILSSYSEFEYARASIRLGVFEYLLKPVVEEDLSLVIKRAAAKIEKDKGLQPDSAALQIPPFPESSDNFYVAQVLRDIQNDYKTKLRIEDIAGQLNVSVSYLSRKIKEVTHKTFLELLNHYRVIKAGELLCSGKYRVYEVSDLIGFINYKYFCTVFKKYTGYPPTAFVP